MTITKEEYLKLIEEVYKESDCFDEQPKIDDIVWMPSESPIKRKIPIRYGSIDATNLKRDDIKKAILNRQQITVGNFLIFIKNEENNLLDICIYETKYKTNTGRPCKMQCKINFLKDSRFEKRPWIHHFIKNNYNLKSASDITKETLEEIIRWLQAITKLPAFI